MVGVQEIEESTERYHNLHSQQQAAQRLYEGQLRDLQHQLSSLHASSSTDPDTGDTADTADTTGNGARDMTQGSYRLQEIWNDIFCLAFSITLIIWAFPCKLMCLGAWIK